jgi:hypothetical protein
MRKHLVIALFVFGMIFSLQAQMPQPQQMKLEDVQKALNLVDKPQPVPDKYKVGFDAITGRDSLAMLTYIASDWMEGRETGTRGYAIAAEYAASLLKMWGVQPAGDMPSFGGGRGGMGGARGGAPAATPPQRTYFQEFGLKTVADVQSAVTIEVNKGGALKARTFQSGVDFAAGGGSGNETITAPVVFVGYGITEPLIQWDELKGLNVKGKIVLVLTEAPGRDDPKSPFNSKKEVKDKFFPAAPAGAQRAMAMGPGAPAPCAITRSPSSRSSAPRPSSRSRTTARTPPSSGSCPPCAASTTSGPSSTSPASGCPSRATRRRPWVPAAARA